MDPDRWMVIAVRVPSESREEDLVEALLALGGAAVQEDDGVLTTYLYPPADTDTFMREAGALLCAAAGSRALEVTWHWQQNEDWARSWRRGLAPRRVGERLIVAPSWTRPDPKPDDIVIVIDPEMAFGTGEHATTRITLALLEASLRPGDRVLDVGTGSGILAIAAALLGAGTVLAVESDAEAEENARDNIQRNGVTERVEFRRALVDADFLTASAPFDLILANVLSGVLVPLLPAFRAALAPTGRLILGGILQEESTKLRRTAAEAGLAVGAQQDEEGWWGVLLRVAEPDRTRAAHD
jgi:ribosomal protein L11 methyltransferase